jgi:hypothetical protein
MEMELAKTPGIFQKSVELPYWKIYKLVAESVPSQRVLAKNTPNVDSPSIPSTQQPGSSSRSTIRPIRSTRSSRSKRLGNRVVFHGSEPRRQGTALLCDLPANDAIVFTVRKAKP